MRFFITIFTVIFLSSALNAFALDNAANTTPKASPDKAASDEADSVYPYESIIPKNSSWYEKEKLRQAKEQELLQKYSKYFSLETKPLVKTRDIFEKNSQDAKDMKYVIKNDKGELLSFNYCSIFGACVGYNEFSDVEGPAGDNEQRLIDVKNDYAFFHNFYHSPETDAIEQPFFLLNLHDFEKIDFANYPHFSDDGKKIVEINDSEFCDECSEGPVTGYNIDIFELDNGKYKLTSSSGQYNIIDGKSDFIARNPNCGPTPHFHSWKNDNEVRLSMLDPTKANEGAKAILSLNPTTKKWSCSKTTEDFPEFKNINYFDKTQE